MSGVVLLDGGMGQELIARSARPPSILWSAQVMLDEPDLVRAVHLDYLRAGARVLTVNAYSVTRIRLERAGLVDRLAALQETACRLAAEARAAFLAERPDLAASDVIIAGCLSPLAWSYDPSATPEPAQARTEYAELAALQAPHVDLFLAETMNSGREAAYAASAAAETGKRVWLSWTLKDCGDAHLRSGETIAEAAAALEGVATAAHLVNCSHPESIAAALPALATLGKPFGGYPNNFASVETLKVGATVDALATRADFTPDAFAETCLGWVRAGATILGGCCEIGPRHIAALAERLTTAGFEIVGDIHD